MEKFAVSNMEDEEKRKMFLAKHITENFIHIFGNSRSIQHSVAYSIKKL